MNNMNADIMNQLTFIISWYNKGDHEVHDQHFRHIIEEELRIQGFMGIEDESLTTDILFDIVLDNILYSQLAPYDGMHVLADFFQYPGDLPTSIQLELLVSLINKLETDQSIADIARGPLENLFCDYCDEIWDPLDHHVKASENMRKAVRGIWCHSTPVLHDKLMKLLNKHDLEYASF